MSNKVEDLLKLQSLVQYIIMYTVSQKRDPDIIDCNLKRD